VGKTSAALVLNPLSANDNGSYSVVVGNPDKTWSSSDVSSLGFVNTPISGVNYVKTGLIRSNQVNSHPDSLTLSVATVAVPSFTVAYPGESATSDVDGDGVPALAEYAYGWSSGLVASGKDLILPQVTQSGNRLILNYQARTNDPKVLVVPESSTELVSGAWATGNVTISNLGPVTLGGEVLEKRSASVPMDGTKRFLRLRVNQSP
jgi:hypothetical protein